nr:RNA-directed DNA polymerase from mobile element jockey-like [Biomphalaria glabrata]
MQRHTDTGDTRSSYESLRCAYGPTYQTTAPLSSSDGSTLLTSKAGILNRWTEHYSMLFGDKRHLLEESLANVPEKNMREKLGDRPTSKEIETAISKLKKHKAPGSDGLPAEIFKMGGVALNERLYAGRSAWSHLNFEIP